MKGFVRVALINNEIEGQILSSILKERRIEHRLQSYHDPAYNGLFQIQKGWGAILAPEDKKGEILEVLGDLRREVKCCEECSVPEDSGDSGDSGETE